MQARLPDELTQRLERAVASWEENRTETARDWLQKALRLASDIGNI